jgi:hypothetical protein
VLPVGVGAETLPGVETGTLGVLVSDFGVVSIEEFGLALVLGTESGLVGFIVSPPVGVLLPPVGVLLPPVGVLVSGVVVVESTAPGFLLLLPVVIGFLVFLVLGLLGLVVVGSAAIVVT